MGRPVVHWELWSPNPGRAADFYKTVFDWDIQHMPEMDYRLVQTGGDGGINGGISRPQNMPTTVSTTFYIDVDDLDAYGRKITAAGGRLVVEGMEVPGMGHFSLFTDPDGRMMGIWKNAS